MAHGFDPLCAQRCSIEQNTLRQNNRYSLLVHIYTCVMLSNAQFQPSNELPYSILISDYVNLSLMNFLSI